MLRPTVRARRVPTNGHGREVPGPFLGHPTVRRVVGRTTTGAGGLALPLSYDICIHKPPITSSCHEPGAATGTSGVVHVGTCQGRGGRERGLLGPPALRLALPAPTPTPDKAATTTVTVDGRPVKCLSRAE